MSSLKSEINTWIFDLDNTLYSADSGIFQQVHELIGKFVSAHLKIAIEEAKKNGSPVPITEIIDGYYAEVQEMGGNRWDSSGLIARLKKKK